MASTMRLVEIAALLGVSKQRAHQLADEGRVRECRRKASRDHLCVAVGSADDRVTAAAMLETI